MADKRLVGGAVKEMMVGWREELVSRRRAMGVTQERIAREAGVNAGYVSQVECGHARLTWELMGAYLEVLGLELGLREVKDD